MKLQKKLKKESLKRKQQESENQIIHQESNINGVRKSSFQEERENSTDKESIQKNRKSLKEKT